MGKNNSLYKFSCISVAVILLFTCVPELKKTFSNSSINDEIESANDETMMDSVAVDTAVVENFDTKGVVWKKYKDDNNLISIEAPDTYVKGEDADYQILALEGKDDEPGLVVIRENKSDLSHLNLSSAKDYAYVILNANKSTEGCSDFLKVSERAVNSDSYQIVYDLTVDGVVCRYNLLAKKTSKSFYYCNVYCLKENLDECSTMIFRMLNSFKVKEK